MLHEVSVHQKENAIKCPQCGKSFSRYYTGNTRSNIFQREDSLIRHFEVKHCGRLQATAKISVCSRCGKIHSCNCKPDKRELEGQEIERRVRDELGFNSETRRYCATWLKIMQHYGVEGLFLMYSLSAWTLLVNQREAESQPELQWKWKLPSIYSTPMLWGCSGEPLAYSCVGVVWNKVKYNLQLVPIFKMTLLLTCPFYQSNYLSLHPWTKMELLIMLDMYPKFLPQELWPGVSAS